MEKKLKELFLKKKKRIFILILIAIILFVLVLPGSFYTLTIDDGIWDDDENSAKPYTQGVKITDEGIQTDKTPQEIWESNSVFEQYLDTPEELAKLMNAEIVTQYPKILENPEEGQLDGIIEFERKTDNNTSTIKMTYMKQEDFDKLIERYNKDGSNKDEILKHFTLDENGVLYVAHWSTTKKNLSPDEGTDVEDSSSVLYQMTKQSIDYKAYVRSYTMPFNYLWTYLVSTENKDLVLELAELVYNSEIVITVFDNISTTVMKDTYTYDQMQKINTYVLAKGKLSRSDGQTSEYSKEDTWLNEESKEGSYTIVNTVTTTTNSITLGVTKANTWVVDYTREYDYKVDGPNVTTTQTDMNSEEYKDSPDKMERSSEDSSLNQNPHAVELVGELRSEIEAQASGITDNNPDGTPITAQSTAWADNVTRAIFYKKINIKDTSEITTTTTKYEGKTPQIEPKSDINAEEPNFVTILAKYSNSKSDLIDGGLADWWFEMLEGNADTTNMELLTRYLLNQFTTNKNKFGDIDFDKELASMFDVSNFSQITTITGGNVKEKVWLTLRGLGFSEIAVAGAMGNFQQESGYKTNNLQDKYNEKWGLSDEEYTAQVNSGSYTNFSDDYGGYGLVQWTFPSRKRGLYEYAINQKKTSIDDENMQIEYLVAEITGTGNAAGCADNIFAGKDITLWSDATTVEAATIAFCNLFEGPGIAHMEKRISYAENFYNQFQGFTAADMDERIGSITLTGDNATQMVNMLNEALRIADDDRYQYSQDKRYDEFYYDCSSFVERLYKQFFNIYRGSNTDQIHSNCQDIRVALDINTLQPGDVLWRNGHVGIYLGNGQYVHASSTQTGIKVSSFNSSSFTEAYRYVQ